MTAPGATLPAARERTAGPGLAGALSPVLGATALAAALVAVVELSVLRIFTRTIVHIPGARDVSPALSVIADFGRFAYYLSCVMVIATIGVLLATFAARDSARAALALGSLGVFVAAASGARLGLVGDGATSATVVASVLGMGFVTAWDLAPRARVVVAGFVAAFVLAGFDALAGTGLPTIADRGALRLASEVLAVGAVACSPLLARTRPDRVSLVVGVVTGTAVMGSLATNASTTKILLLWNFGLPGALPAIAYGLALGAFACTIALLWRGGDRLTVAALALLVAGGIGLHSTYQSALVVTGLALLGPAATPAYGWRSTGPGSRCG